MDQQRGLFEGGPPDDETAVGHAAMIYLFVQTICSLANISLQQLPLELVNRCGFGRTTGP